METERDLVDTLDKIRSLSSCTLSQHKLGIDNVQTFINQAKYAAEHIVLLVDSMKSQMTQPKHENKDKMEQDYVVSMEVN